MHQLSNLFLNKTRPNCLTSHLKTFCETKSAPCLWPLPELISQNLSGIFFRKFGDLLYCQSITNSRHAANRPLGQMLAGQLLIPNPEVKNSAWQDWGMLVFILLCEIWSVTTWVLLPYNFASLWKPLHFLSGKSAKSKHLCLPRTLAMPLGGFVSWPCSFVGKFWSPYKTYTL